MSLFDIASKEKASQELELKTQEADFWTDTENSTKVLQEMKVLKNKVLFRHFDADGIWQDEPYEILFSQITTVTFGSRYVEVFSKYV